MRQTLIFFAHSKPEILALDIRQCLAKIELCPMKTASQETQLSGGKLKQLFK